MSGPPVPIVYSSPAHPCYAGLVMPATNAVSERSFSAMNRIKTYLRSTMGQARLNHLMILHNQKTQTDHHCTDQLKLTDAANDFVGNSEHWRSLFGTFSDSSAKE